MKIDRSKFFADFKKTFGRFLISQQVGFEAIFDEWDKQKLTDLRWLAYMLATVWHETGKKMVPVDEIGRGSGRQYGYKVKRSGVKYSFPDEIYYGRGHVQLTWYENYELMGRLIGVDLLRHPEKAKDMETSIKIMFEGMLRGASSFGDFTGKCLEQYFNENVNDAIGARRIINSKDKAEVIAEHYHKFLACL
jgi:putative chitinase